MASMMSVLTAPSGVESNRSSRISGFYRPELDSLRFIAFFAVFLHHSLPRNADFYVRHALLPKTLARWPEALVNSGGFGVDLFFALSSYLITELLLRELRIRGSLDVKAFWIRRALRIWPLYFFFVAFAFVLGWLVPTEKLSSSYFTAFVLFCANWACTAWSYPASVAAPLWSVSIEEQFYIAWPLLLRRATPRRVARVSLLLLAIATLTRALLLSRGARYPAEVEHPTIWCNTFARLDPIALGALLAVILRGRVPRISPSGRMALLIGGLLTTTIVARYCEIYKERSWIGILAGYPAVALGVVAILLSVLGAPKPGSLFLHRWFVYLGRISYGLYVYHRLGLLIADYFASGRTGRAFAVHWIVAFTTTLLLAAASYKFLEGPFLRMKERFTYVTSRPCEVTAVRNPS